MSESPEEHGGNLTADYETRAKTRARSNGQDMQRAWPRNPSHATPIKLFSYTEMVALPESEFVVHGIIVRRAKNVLFGPSNSFKSFMAADMGGSVSTGRSYHGMAVIKCPVIYVANEGANAVGRKRIPAWMAAHEIPQEQRGNIYLVNAETIFPNEKSRNNLLAAIRTIVSPGDEFFLIIDVLRGTMTGSDSDDETAAAWTMAAEILVKEGATILTLTHSPYSDDGRIRGSSHLWGSFEGRLHAEGDKEKRTAVLSVDRFKDHDSAGQWGFQLDEIEIKEHPGEFSLVPRLDGDVKPKKASQSKRKLPASAQNALTALRYALDEVGEIPPASNHIPAKTKCITIKQWRDYFYIRSTQDKQDTKRRAFDRGSDIVIAEKKAGAWESFAWII
jgi:AAA domain